jgi:hypothetical protein
MSEPETGSDATAPSGADDIKADIERTRSELSDTVDELAHRLDVKSQVEERAASVRQAVAEKTPPNAGKIAAGAAAALVVVLVVRRVRRRRRNRKRR